MRLPSFFLPRSRGHRVIALAMGCGVFVAGCAGSSSSTNASSVAVASSTSEQPTPTPTLRSPIEQRCGVAVPRDVRVSQSTVRSADGVSLQEVLLGSGPRGVMLLHQTDRSALCGWLSYGGYLAGRGFHVGLVDLRCHGESSWPPDPAAADNVLADVVTVSSHLRADGAQTLDMVGASYGAAVAIGACARVRAVACAALSPALLDNDLGGGATATTAISRLGKPLLIAVQPGDGDSPMEADRALAAAAPPHTVRFQVLPAGSGHGWDTVVDQDEPSRWSPFSEQLIRFLSAAR